MSILNFGNNLIPAILLCACIGFVIWFLRKQYEILHKENDVWGEIQIQFFLSPEAISRIRVQQPHDTKGLRQHNLLWCLFWILLAGMQMLAAGNVSQHALLKVWMNRTAVAALPFSLLESFLLCNEKKKYSRLLSTAGWIKWILLIIWCVMLFGNLVWRGWQL